MPFNRNHVRAFLAKGEIDLFESSLGPALKAMTAADVHRRIDRTRKLRSKYRDLLQRQRLAMRARTTSKAGDNGDANERTAKKARAFDETLTRFEAHAHHLQAVAEQADERPAGKANSGAAATRKPSATKRSAKPRSVPAAVTLREALQKRRAAEPPAPAANATGSRKRPALSIATAGGESVTHANVRAAAVAARLDQSGLQRIQGHTGSQVRRAQAKRDHRG